MMSREQKKQIRSLVKAARRERLAGDSYESTGLLCDAMAFRIAKLPARRDSYSTKR